MHMMETAKLFTNGRSQAVRLPKKFRLHGKVRIILALAAAGAEEVCTIISTTQEKNGEARKTITASKNQ